MGSGCGSVGRAVASDTGGPRFESSHGKLLYLTLRFLFTVNCNEKTKIKKKMVGMAHFFKKRRYSNVRNRVSPFVTRESFLLKRDVRV